LTRFLDLQNARSSSLISLKKKETWPWGDFWGSAEIGDAKKYIFYVGTKTMSNIGEVFQIVVEIGREATRAQTGSHQKLLSRTVFLNIMTLLLCPKASIL